MATRRPDVVRMTLVWHPSMIFYVNVAGPSWSLHDTFGSESRVGCSTFMGLVLAVSMKGTSDEQPSASACRCGLCPVVELRRFFILQASNLHRDRFLGAQSAYILYNDILRIVALFIFLQQSRNFEQGGYSPHRCHHTRKTHFSKLAARFLLYTFSSELDGNIKQKRKHTQFLLPKTIVGGSLATSWRIHPPNR